MFDLAKTQHKKVFLEVYLPDCHVCQLYEPVFKNTAVAKYYNDHFINYGLSAENMETYAFLQKQNVTVLTTPTFLFYGDDVKLIYEVALSEKQNTPEIILKQTAKDLSIKTSK